MGAGGEDGGGEWGRSSVSGFTTELYGHSILLKNSFGAYIIKWFLAVFLTPGAILIPRIWSAVFLDLPPGESNA